MLNLLIIQTVPLLLQFCALHDPNIVYIAKYH